jgi:drug/metabolite transporter (DMT)-like permease
MVAGAVAHHLTGLAAGEPGPLAVAWTARSAAAVAVVGVGSTALAFPAYFALIARLGPTRANLVSYAVPVVAAVTGAVVLGESLAARTVVGFLVVAAGFALVASRSLADGLAPRLPFRP